MKILIKLVNLIRIIVQKIVGFLFSIFIKRNNKYIAVGCFVDNINMFMHNTKYLFLYLNNIDREYKCVWLTDDRNIINKLINCGYKNIYKRTSIKGIWYALRAKYWLYDYSPTSVANKSYCNGAILINLWHGIPLKKIAFDDLNNNFNKYPSLQKKLYLSFKIKDSFYITNGEYEQKCYKTAFLEEKEKMKIIGSPRLDVLYRDIEGQDLFMEEDFANIKSLHEQGKKLVVYMPTFRDTEKDISGWLRSEKLQQFLKENNAVMICKLHPYDANGLNFDDCEELYKMNNNSDIYPVLKYSDALITDYSSINFDYLLLDKPIMYYVPDLEEYQEKCRGFYTPYSEFAVGGICKTEDELLSAMQDVIDGKDDYKEQRKLLRDKMFKYQDGRNCERVVEWIKSLDEKGK